MRHYNLYSIHTCIRLCRCLKSFHPANFRKQDYLFWPKISLDLLIKAWLWKSETIFKKRNVIKSMAYISKFLLQFCMRYKFRIRNYLTLCLSFEKIKIRTTCDGACITDILFMINMFFCLSFEDHADYFIYPKFII